MIALQLNEMLYYLSAKLTGGYLIDLFYMMYGLLQWPYDFH